MYMDEILSFTCLAIIRMLPSFWRRPIYGLKVAIQSYWLFDCGVRMMTRIIYSECLSYTAGVLHAVNCLFSSSII